MVKRGGIPWQSKGCWTCKKRRIKCDQGKPDCNRCIKRGIQCLGYEKHGVFINYSALQDEKTASKGPIQRNTRAQHFASINHVSHAPAMRDQVFAAYIDGYFPTQMDVSGVDLWRYLVQGFLRLPYKSEMLDKTLSSISCLYLGKVYHDTHMFKYGLQLYNGAIRLMSNMISRDNFNEDIVYTAVIFQEIESYYCPNGLGPWVAHIKGLNTILKHYRRKPSENPLMGPIYQRYQKLRTIQSSSARNLQPDEFKYLAEATDGTPFSELLRIFAELSPLAAKLSALDSSDLSACLDLLQSCMKSKNHFFEWYSDHHMADGISADPPPEFLSSDMPPSEHLFGVTYHFLTFDYVLLHLYYWAGLILLYPSIASAKRFVLSHPESNIPSEFLSTVTNPLEDEEYLETTSYADEVCRAMRYCVGDHMKVSGLHVTLFPLCAASQFYCASGDLEKFSWCIKVVESAAARGHGTAPHLVDLSWKAWFAQNESGPVTTISLREAFPEGEPARNYRIVQDVTNEN